MGRRLLSGPVVVADHCGRYCLSCARHTHRPLVLAAGSKPRGPLQHLAQLTAPPVELPQALATPAHQWSPQMITLLHKIDSASR
jgi:hypothetical protein